jgi:hypothetical protein
MSLMQLLTVGHSLTKPVEAPSPFRMIGPGWLPKFRPGESPVGQSGVAGTVEEGRSRGELRSIGAKCRVVTLRQQVLPLAGDQAKAAQQGTCELPNELGVAKPAPKPRGRWSLPSDPMPDVPKRAQFAPPTVLSSIEAVKVMRNDLNDEDLALVPTGKTSARTNRCEPKTEIVSPTSQFWDRLKAQVQRVAKTLKHV